MEPPDWLVENMLPEEALIGLYAPPESLKSFLALDWAMSIAAGRDWNGRPVKQGYVVYISAEGGSGIGRRADSWLVHNKVNLREVNDNIAWLIETIPVNADSVEVALLMERLENELEREPVLIVIDTLARCFVGNENQQEDMGAFIAGVDLLRKSFRCAVLVVHHTRLDGDRERGNTAFRGAADTMIAIEGDEADPNGGWTTINVTCAKQKDAEHFSSFKLEKVVVPGTTSCVLQLTDTPSSKEDKVAAIIDIIQQGPLPYAEWLAASALAPVEFAKRFQWALVGRLIVKRDGKWGVAAGD